MPAALRTPAPHRCSPGRGGPAPGHGGPKPVRAGTWWVKAVARNPGPGLGRPGGRRARGGPRTTRPEPSRDTCGHPPRTRTTRSVQPPRPSRPSTGNAPPTRAAADSPDRRNANAPKGIRAQAFAGVHRSSQGARTARTRHGSASGTGTPRPHPAMVARLAVPRRGTEVVVRHAPGHL